jgi:hypothetical protein
MPDIIAKEKAQEMAAKHGYAPKPKGMDFNAWSMGQRQIAQAKMRGNWRGNQY